jgi:hypothetical protein
MAKAHPLFNKSGMKEFLPDRDDKPHYYLFKKSPPSRGTGASPVSSKTLSDLRKSAPSAPSAFNSASPPSPPSKLAPVGPAVPDNSFTCSPPSRPSKNSYTATRHK